MAELNDGEAQVALRVAPERCNILMCKRITAPAQGHERRDVFRRRGGMSAAKETREERSDLKVASYNHQVRQRSNRWAAQPWPIGQNRETQSAARASCFREGFHS